MRARVPRVPVLVAATVLAALAWAAMTTPAQAQRWVTSWAGSAQGPYPSGNAAAQPELKWAFPGDVVRDQTFRLIVRPSLWSRRIRLRFSNAFGKEALAIDGALAGLQMSGAAVMPGSNRPVTFKGKKSVSIPPGEQAWSDAVALPWVSNPDAPELRGRKLAVSFHVAGEVKAATWHAKAMQTSYVTAPGAGALGELEDEGAFPNSTASWYFLDALDADAPAGTGAVICFGDSITDGTGSTLNGDDRWPDVLGRRLQGSEMATAVVNAGIGGNQVVGPAEYGPDKPAAGGPSAVQRLERDVLGLSGVTHVIWLEGINDFSASGGAGFEQVRDAMTESAKRLRQKLKGVKLIGATLTPVIGTVAAGHGSAEQERKRRALNDFIRSSGGVFDGVVDFEKATVDRRTGGLRAEFVPSSTAGGPGDGLHPNRAGYMAMGDAVDLRLLRGPAVPKPKPRPPPEDSGE